MPTQKKTKASLRTQNGKTNGHHANGIQQVKQPSIKKSSTGRSNGNGKYILKRAIEDLIPDEVISRRKMGFPTPLRAWLSGSSAAPVFEILLDRQGLLAEYLDTTALEKMLDRHRNGRLDATDRIWRLLNLQLWGRAFLSGRIERSPFLHEDPVGQV